MAKYPVKIVQSFKVYRTIVVLIDAEDPPAALEAVASGSQDVPEFDDPRWNPVWDLQDETVTLDASATREKGTAA